MPEFTMVVDVGPQNLLVVSGPTISVLLENLFIFGLTGDLIKEIGKVIKDHEIISGKNYLLDGRVELTISPF